VSISSILSSLTGTQHAAFSTQSATSTASEELQKLFSKLHMDAIASAATSSSTASAASTSTTATSTGAAPASVVTGIASGLRHLFDGGLTAVKDARSAAKAVSGYTHGAGLGHLASQALDKLA
jgi:hypothetical protein